MYKVYNLSRFVENPFFSEFNLVIQNGNKTIFVNNDGVHNVYKNLDEKVLNNGTTVKQILDTEPDQTVSDVGTWVRTFGSRIETNYQLLLKSINQIGLDSKDFPRKIESL